MTFGLYFPNRDDPDQPENKQHPQSPACVAVITTSACAKDVHIFMKRSLFLYETYRGGQYIAHT